jgi:hypothetical protein
MSGQPDRLRSNSYAQNKRNCDRDLVAIDLE